MNELLIPFLTSTATSNSEGSSSNGSAEGIKNALKNLVKNPVFYIVIGVIVLLIIAVYLYRRIVKPRANVVTVVVRGGSIRKLVDEKSPKYFRVPFIDGVGAVISLNERELNSDKLYINNGPDALYKIDYVLKYKVEDVQLFFKYMESFSSIIPTKINDALREYADNGRASDLINNYREKASTILGIIDGITKEYGVTSLSFKVNYIEPLGKK